MSATSTIPWDRLRGAGSKLTTPLHPDDYLRLINPLWTSRELRGRVEKVVPETDAAATLVIRPGWGYFLLDLDAAQYDLREGPATKLRPIPCTPPLLIWRSRTWTRWVNCSATTPRWPSRS